MVRYRDRRSFLKSVAGVAAGAAVAPSVLTQLGCSAPDESAAPKRILILGGTGFIGPHMVRYAHQRGHEVTIFNRGNRRPTLPEGIEWLIGDRNDDLTALEGREWDVVIDNPTTLPKWVRSAASLLQDAADQYIFVSTISAYGSETNAWADESDPVAEYTGEDAFAEERVTGGLYGPLKAVSEQEAERWFPGKTTVVRPGLIVGPGDPTDRFTYWPVRVARGGEVLAPPAADPVQVIDVRDLTHWIVRLAEAGVTGTFNATGPRDPLSMGELLAASKRASGSDATFTHVTPEFLAEQEVRAWSQMPTWVPDTPENAAFSRRSIEKGVEAGLTFLPLEETISDTLEWHATRPEEERGPSLRSGLSPEREAEVLSAWHAT